jgi:hypothetical protein
MEKYIFQWLGLHKRVVYLQIIFGVSYVTYGAMMYFSFTKQSYKTN